MPDCKAVLDSLGRAFSFDAEGDGVIAHVGMRIDFRGVEEARNLIKRITEAGCFVSNIDRDEEEVWFDVSPFKIYTPRELKEISGLPDRISGSSNYAYWRTESGLRSPIFIFMQVIEGDQSKFVILKSVGSPYEAPHFDFKGFTPGVSTRRGFVEIPHRVIGLDESDIQKKVADFVSKHRDTEVSETSW